jgi:monoamine oxidase
MRSDLRRLSNAPSAERHNAADEELDRTSLEEYLEARGAGPIAKAAISEAYLAEYGLETGEQSALNFLLFIHADRRSKFKPFGVSDERWHIVDGNDRIAQGLAARLPRPVELGTTLVRVARRSDGRVELTFERDRRTFVRSHDAVVLTLPFTVLRTLDLHASLALPDWKRDAIEQLGYGTNAKMMVGFTSRPWALAENNGASYSDLANHQTTWETNPSLARDDRAVLTDYSSGAGGASLDPSQTQREASRFLGDLDRVYPGARAAASRDSRDQLLARLEHWPSNPLTRGSYTCYLPGQFTTIAGREATPVGNLFFAGEHTDSFYQWQGFMEGAALSGIAAAAALRAVARAQ